MWLMVDMSVSESGHMHWSLALPKTCANLPASKDPDKRLGSKHRPMIDVEPDDIVADFLHLLLRVTDINLIFRIVKLDLKTCRKSAKKNLYRFAFVYGPKVSWVLWNKHYCVIPIAYLLGVSFAVWKSTNTAGPNSERPARVNFS